MKTAFTSILTEWLSNHGYDGLYCEDCGCSYEDGIMPCSMSTDEVLEVCEAGYRIIPDSELEEDFLDYDYIICESKNYPGEYKPCERVDYNEH